MNDYLPRKQAAAPNASGAPSGLHPSVLNEINRSLMAQALRNSQIQLAAAQQAQQQQQQRQQQQQQPTTTVTVEETTPTNNDETSVKEEVKVTPAPSDTSEQPATPASNQLALGDTSTPVDGADNGSPNQATRKSVIEGKVLIISQDFANYANQIRLFS